MPRTPTADDVTLLWAAASPFPEVGIVSAAAERADLVYVLETAASNRVAPLVLRALKAAGVEVDPDATWAVSQVRAWQAHSALALPAAAAAALGPLSREGLDPLLLKGLALVNRYPAPGLRPMDDIDLLLPPRLSEWAAAVLLRAGWRRGGHTGIDPRYDLTFLNERAPGVPLELHYQFIEWKERPKILEAERLWATRVPATVFDHPAYTLPPELELMTLIIHAAKGFHLFDRLLWMADLVVAARAAPMDWDEVMRLAIATRRRVATAVALRLATRLGADVPAELLVIPHVLEQAGALGALLDPAHPFAAQTKSWWVNYSLVDTIGAKARLALGEFVRPPRHRARAQVVGDLAKLVGHAGPTLIRARLGLDRRRR